MNLVIIYLGLATSYVLLLFFAAQILPHKLNIWKIIGLSLVASTPVLIANSLERFSLPFFIMSMFTIVGLLCIPALFYLGKLWKRYAVFISLLICQFLVEMIVDILVTAFYGTMGVAFIDVAFVELMPVIIFYSLFMVLFALLGITFIVIWKMIPTRKFQPYFLMLLIAPIGQVIIFFSFLYEFLGLFWIVGLLIGLAANLVMLVFVISLEKKTALQTELTELQHIRELEQLHYAGVEQRRQELTKIRHDFNNQLAAAHQLITTDKKDHAQKLLDELKQSIVDTEEYQYCQNAIVNAVIMEKQKECDATGIRLETDVTLDENCNITQTHLCSIFTNLLDNAIRACESIPQEQRLIELRTAAKGIICILNV